MKRQSISVIIVLPLLIGFTASFAQAADRYSVATGNWGSTSTWSATSGGSSGASVPVAGDNVYIERTYTVTIAANAACATITIGTANGAGTLTFRGASSTNYTLTVSGNISVASNGSLTVTNVTSYNYQHTLNIGGNLTVDGIFNMTTANDDGAATVLNGSSQQTISGSGTTCTFEVLTISNANSAGVVLGRNIVLATSTQATTNSDLTISANDVFDLSSYTADRATGGSGTLTVNAGATLKIGGTGTFPANYTTNTLNASSTVIYNGTTQTVGTQTYGNLTLSGTGAKTFPTGTTTVNGILSIENAANANTFTGTLAYGTNATLQYNTTSARTASTEWVTPFAATGGVIIASTGTITLNAAKAFNASVPLTINSGAALATGNFQLTFGGNFANNGGTFTAGSSAIVIGTGTATQSIASFTTTGAVSMTKTGGTATFTGNVNGGALTINGSGGTLNLGTSRTHTFTGTWTRTAGTLDGGSSTLNLGGALSGTGGTFTASTSTVNYNGSAQAIAAVTYNNLTINQSSGDATLGGAATVDGTLTLTSGNLAITDPNELTMGASAATVGAKDVTGIVTRTSFVAATTYTFGNQYSTVNFQNVGTLPTGMKAKITIGSAPSWKTDAVQRYVEMIQSGASGCYATLNTHYLDSELNGNTENKLVLWGYPTGGPAVEFGRSNYNTTENWVGISGVDVSQIASSFGQLVSALGDSKLSNATWNGSTSTAWMLAANWTPSGVPSDLADVVIPDASTTPNDPTLPPDSVKIGRLTINSGGVLNSTATSTLTISGASGAWSDNGGTFNPSTSTVIFTNAAATVSGETEFYNVTINSGAALTMGSGGTMRIGGTMTNNGTWHAALLANNTVEYNGGSQTVLNPNGLTPGYDNLILSGSGTKTLPGTALSIHGDFSMSGTATATAGAAMTITGNFTLGSGTTFTTGALSHSIGGNFSNNGGTFTATGSTITFDGSGAQAVAAATYHNLTIAKSGGTATLSGSITVNSDLTVSSGALDLSTFTANRASAGGTLTVSNGATLSIGGTGTLPSNYSTHSIGATSTINYAGTTQTVAVLNSSQNYGNLTISGSGAKTLAGSETVSGTLTISAGTLADGGFTLSVNGNIANSASHTGTGKISLTGGSATHTLSGGGSYTNLELNDANGATLSSDLTINGTLTFTSGEITLGSNNLTIGSSGSISGGSSSKLYRHQQHGCPHTQRCRREQCGLPCRDIFHLQPRHHQQRWNFR